MVLPIKSIVLRVKSIVLRVKTSVLRLKHWINDPFGHKLQILYRKILLLKNQQKQKKHYIEK